MTDKWPYTVFVSMMTSPYSLKRSMTFLQSWQNGWWQSVKLSCGDHGPQAVLSQRGLNPPSTNLNTKHYKLVEFLSNFHVKTPLHERKAPLLTTFW